MLADCAFFWSVFLSTRGYRAATHIDNSIAALLDTLHVVVERITVRYLFTAALEPSRLPDTAQVGRSVTSGFVHLSGIGRRESVAIAARRMIDRMK